MMSSHAVTPGERGGQLGRRRGSAGVPWRSLPGCLLGCALVCLALAAPAAAGTAGSPLSAFTLRVENDAIQSTDANYSAGLSLGYTRNDSGMWGGIWRAIGLDRGRLYSSYELAQLIFTPTDMNRTSPDPHDRPYAGILYFGMTTGLQTDTSLQALKLLVGVIGPSSLGEAGQRETHHLLGNTLPKGWDHQLKDEPILNLLYEYRHKYLLAGNGSGFGADLIPIGTAMFGNYLTKASVAGELRFGFRLPDDFGDTTISGLGSTPLPELHDGVSDKGMYLFAGGGGELVVRDTTLDGSTFRAGPNVGKEPFVSSGFIGFALRSGNFLSAFTYILRGREFSGQHEGERYGSLALTYLFR